MLIKRRGLSVADILERLATGTPAIDVTGLTGAARAYLLAKIVAHFRERTLLVVTPLPATALSFSDDCRIFFSAADTERLVLFPAPDVLPYTQLAIDPVILADRTEVLHRLIQGAPLVLIAPMAACLRRLPPRQFITQSTETLRVGETFPRADLAALLVELGYEEVGLVEDEGAFALRGAIVDLWPPTALLPTRLELDGDRIARLCPFNPTTQRSEGEVRDVTLIAVRDFSLSVAARARAAEKIRKLADAADLPAGERRALLEQLHEGIAFAGIDTFFPAFHESLASLADYLPPDCLVIVDDPVGCEQAAEKFSQSLQELAHTTRNRERIVPPDLLALTAADWAQQLTARPRMSWNGSSAILTATTMSNVDLRSLIRSHQSGEDMLTPLAVRLKDWLAAGERIVLVCHTELQAERLIDLFRPHDLAVVAFAAPFATLEKLTDRALRVRLGRVSAGFRWPDEHLIVIGDHEIFGARHARRASPKAPAEAFSSFAELAEGDYLVHERFGLGRYQGLQHLTVGGKSGDYLLMEYLGGDKLYLPVYHLNLVERYVGPGDQPPPLDRLGGERFHHLQKRVRRDLLSIARELLKIHAAREMEAGFSFPAADLAAEEFAAAFPFDETPDQERAIDDVGRDLEKDRPMDRLICGDVGYGKTEVAMRAAFRVAMAGKQVACLVPTTILAFQHFETFSARFKETPVKVEMLSRFRTTAEQKAIVADLKRGAVDIVIGTHRLLSRDVAFRDLGLLITDEEHRFGVVHKERIKKLRATVDCLTLTATPIPRTLNLSLAGLRDISIINTPPANRQAIATHVVPFDDGTIRHAIREEIARGGQVFFVHNRVETMGAMAERLAKIVPEAAIGVAHGQMGERELEAVMLRFVRRECPVLLTTAIIESGLDIPNANTIIIHRADTFGLAQLYQLRGRVGRSDVHAVAYLLIPADGGITPIAKRRLATLTRFTELGSGFQIAMHDLEIRGAGNILGRAQSGHIAAVGYELYTKLLARAIRQLRAEKTNDTIAAELEDVDPELHLNVSAFLPPYYIADEATRIELYRRLANRETQEEIAALGQELRDRFGVPPPEAKRLLTVMDIKCLARELKIKTLTANVTGLGLTFDRRTALEPAVIMQLAAREPKRFQLEPPDRLIIRMDADANDDTLLDATKFHLSRLRGCVSGAHHP